MGEMAEWAARFDQSQEWLDLIHAPTEKTAVFVHVPKTAGSSLKQAIAGSYGVEVERIKVPRMDPADLGAWHNALDLDGVAAIAGHTAAYLAHHGQPRARGGPPQQRRRRAGGVAGHVAPGDRAVRLGVSAAA